jgi:hypothetical protein
LHSDERGEVAIEGTGTLDLNIAERTGMQRVDVRELNGSMRTLARSPLLAGFRYQRSPSNAPGLRMQVSRFDDADVLAAAVDRAEATTLVTSEGRALTEVKLHVQNRAQPFLRVTLTTGASIASVEVGGQAAKPVLGDDGTRVPLLHGQVIVTAAQSGFFPQTTTFNSTGAAQRVEAVLPVAALEETVTVAAAAPAVAANEPSENIVNLQRRAAGVLPIPIDVPRAGSSHRFARPIVVDDETTVRFRYARR